MKVITLDKTDFSASCRRLADEVISCGFTPELIVGIRTGGEYVAREVMAAFPSARLAVVELQRPSTRSKSQFRSLLRRLPRPVLDIMRMAEAQLLALKPKGCVPDIALPQGLVGDGERKILVVDDAVDSGVTLSVIVKALRKAHPGADVHTAVITVATLRPLIRPYHCLYNNRTLIRFPWSMDMKK